MEHQEKKQEQQQTNALAQPQQEQSEREGGLSAMPPAPFAEVDSSAGGGSLTAGLVPQVGEKDPRGEMQPFNPLEHIEAPKGEGGDGNPNAGGDASGGDSGGNEQPNGEGNADSSSSSATVVVAEGANGGGNQVAAPTGLADAASVSTTPRSPEEDPNFQALKEQSNQLASAQSTHETAEAASSSAQAAAPLAGNEQLGLAQVGQAEVMDGQEAGDFDVDAFKSAILSQIKLPENEDEADDFDSNNNLDQVKESTSSKVAGEKDKAGGAIESSTEKEPDPSAVAARIIDPLAPPAIGTKPAPLNAGNAMPPVRGDAEVVTPLQNNVAEVDQKMADNEVTDEQLAKSNEPKFTAALGAKNTAKKDAESAPAAFRSKEASALSTTKNSAAAKDQESVAAMFGDRESALLGQQTQQNQTADKDSKERERISGELNKIFLKTKTDVETILTNLDAEVETKFNAGSDKAKQKFEAYVKKKMDAYKEERYEGFGGAVNWFGDVFTGLPDEVNEFFQEGKQIYIDEMDAVLTVIGNHVGKQLAAAKNRIAQGKQEINTYLATLPANLQSIGQEAAGELQSQFDELEASVKDKESELVDSIAELYNAGLETIDARIEEMKAANRGLIDMALDGILGVIEIIIEIKNMLTSLIAAAIDVIGAIIADPIGFLSNLIDGVSQGLMNFGANIMDHLTTGLVGWLTGALGSLGIELPEDIFSLKGIFSLVTQALGLSWNAIRAIGSKILGEKVMGALETGLEMFMIIKNEGLAGVWDYIKEQFSDLQETVMGAIKDMVITQVMEAGIKWVVSLFTPAGAFVKAAMAIIDMVKFFVQGGMAQIVEFGTAIVDSLKAIASGDVSQVAAAIENALSKAVPVLIGVLAAILGLSDIRKSVVKILKKIRDRVVAAIKKLFLKAKEMGKSILSKLGFGGDEEDKKKQEASSEPSSMKEPIGEVIPIKVGSDKHTLWVERKGKKGEVRMASNEDTVVNHLKEWKNKVKSAKDSVETAEDKKIVLRILDEIIKAETIAKGTNGAGTVLIALLEKEDDKGVKSKEDALENKEINLANLITNILGLIKVNGRVLGLDPDKTAAEGADNEDGRRWDDAPISSEFASAFNKLENLYISARNKLEKPEKLSDLEGLTVKISSDKIKDSKLKFSERTEFSSTIKYLVKGYKADYRNIKDQTPKEDLIKKFKADVNTIIIDVKNMEAAVKVWFKQNIGDLPSDEDLKAEGDELWREEWKVAMSKVNLVLSAAWSKFKPQLKALVRDTKEIPDKYGPDQIGDISYIGSLAKGVKGPPKQHIRFNPFEYDVDANLNAPPLAYLAIYILGVKPDRGRIFGSDSKIKQIIQFGDTVDKKIQQIGIFDPSDPFDLVILGDTEEQKDYQNISQVLVHLKENLDGDIYKKLIFNMKNNDHLDKAGKLMETEEKPWLEPKDKASILNIITGLNLKVKLRFEVEEILNPEK